MTIMNKTQDYDYDDDQKRQIINNNKLQLRVYS